MLFPPIAISEQTIAQAVAALVTNELNAENKNSIQQNALRSPFTACDSFRLNSIPVREIRLKANEKDCLVQLKQIGSSYEIKVNDAEWKKCSVRMVKDAIENRYTLKLNLDGIQSTFSAVIASNTIDIFNEVKQYLYFPIEIGN